MYALDTCFQVTLYKKWDIKATTGLHLMEEEVFVGAEVFTG